MEVSGDIDIFGGAFSGSGDVSGTVHNFAVLRLGNSPGSLLISGGYAQGATAALAMEIGGLTQTTEYDVVQVTGEAAPAGRLTVDLVDLGGGVFVFEAGKTFDILLAESIVGTFEILNFAGPGPGMAWTTNYLLDAIGTTDVVRLGVVGAVPLPGGLWLMGPCLIALAGFSRGRRFRGGIAKLTAASAHSRNEKVKIPISWVPVSA